MNIVLKYFPNITATQKEQFEKLQELYGIWNAQINVISRKEIDLLQERHVLHSLGIAKVIQFKPNTRVLDVGTGGGFPGIPLAILFPEAQFYLADSIGKKIKVVKEITAALELKNVTAENIRAEQIEEKFDFVVSRAVTEFPVFYNWVKDKFSKEQFNDLENGTLFLKGGDLREEFKQHLRKCKFYELKDFFSEEFFETKKVVYLPRF